MRVALKCPAGVRPDVHERFMKVLERAEAREAEILAMIAANRESIGDAELSSWGWGDGPMRPEVAIREDQPVTVKIDEEAEG